MSRLRFLLALVAGGICGWCGAASAWAAVTPGWECIPTTAGQSVVSGGTGSAPSCGAGTTAVLAPTYVSSGVGGKPTVRFASVNVQILNGAGSTATKNGEGNLVLGYDESPGAQTGSHDLILGQHQTFTGYSELLDGSQDTASGAYAAVFGYSDKGGGSYSLAAGEHNSAAASGASVTGGIYNTASASFSSVTGGCSNIAGPSSMAIQSICSNTSTYPNAFASVTGGDGNHASATDSSVSGGYFNSASALSASVSGGEDNQASGNVTSILGGFEETLTGPSTESQAGTTKFNP